MSRENIAVVQGLFDLWNQGDFETGKKFFDPDVVIDRSASVGPDARVYRGVAETEQFWRDWNKAWAGAHWEIDECLANGERVAVFGRFRANGVGSGVEVAANICQVFELDDGKVRKATLFQDSAEALEAAGLGKNVESFRRGAEAINRRDIDALIGELDPEVEWHDVFHLMLGGKTTLYRGHEGVRELFRDLFASFADVQGDYTEFRSSDERVVALGTLRGRGLGSGVEIESEVATVADFAGGKAIRLQTYLSHGEALEAVGTEE